MQHRNRNGRGGRGQGGAVPPNILGGEPDPPNTYPATHLIQAYAIQ